MQVALQYYNQECAITLVSEEMDGYLISNK